MPAGDVFRKSAQNLESALVTRRQQAHALEDQAKDLRRQAADLIKQADVLSLQSKAIYGEVTGSQQQINSLKKQATAADASEKLVNS